MEKDANFSLKTISHTQNELIIIIIFGAFWINTQIVFDSLFIKQFGGQIPMSTITNKLI